MRHATGTAGTGTTRATVALLAFALVWLPGPAPATQAGGGAGADQSNVQSVADGLRLPPDTAATRGRWQLRSAAGGGIVLAWRSPADIPVTDARVELRVPARGGSRVVAVPELTDDRRGLRVAPAALAGVDTARLQVWLGADRLDRAGRLAPAYRGSSAAARGVQTVPVDVLAANPGAPGRFEVLEPFDYRAAPLPWREFDAPMEVRGHVVLPDRQGAAPLVLFLHGRHLPCYRGRWSGDWPCDRGSRPVPSQLGYDYLQRRLATQGFASVSIAANAVNAQDYQSPDGGAASRSRLVRHHLRLLAQWAGDRARQRFFGGLDVDRTVLVGHSRGGEGVAHAVLDTPAAAAYDVRGEVLIAPTNFARVATPFTPSVTMLPYCDGDVIDLQGQTYTDLGRDLASGDTAFRSSVLMRGANHNFFNTEWTPGRSQAPSFDDWFADRHRLCGRDSPTRLSATEQRVAGTAWVAAAVRLFQRGNTSMLDALDAAGAVTVPRLPDGAVWTHALGGDRELVRPGADATASRGGGRLCRAATEAGFSFEKVPAPALADCGEGLSELRTVHWFPGAPRGLPLPRELQFGWRAPGATGGLLLREPLDLSGRTTTLDLRTVVDPRLGPARFAVRLTDTDGVGWTSRRVGVTNLEGRYIRTWWAQTVRLRLAGVRPALDLTRVGKIELIGRSADGRVWVLDAAARRPALRPVSERDVPAVSLQRRLDVDEGDVPRSIEVPWRLDAAAPVAGRFAVIIGSSTPAAKSRVTVVEVPAGTDRGTVAVDYEADRADDRPLEYVELFAVPLRNLTGGQTYGRVVVRDDDRDVRARVVRAGRRVERGESMSWTVRLNRPADYDLYVRVRGPDTEPEQQMLRIGDVPRRWIERVIGSGKPHARLGPRLSRELRIGAGDRAVTFAVPTRRNSAVAERSRTLTLQFADPSLDGSVRSTIRLRAQGVGRN